MKIQHADLIGIAVGTVVGASGPLFSDTPEVIFGVFVVGVTIMGLGMLAWERNRPKHTEPEPAHNQEAVRMPDYSKPRGRWKYAGAIGTKATQSTTILIANNHECKEVEVPGYGLYFDPQPIGERIADEWNQKEEQERLTKELEFQHEVERDNHKDYDQRSRGSNTRKV